MSTYLSTANDCGCGIWSWLHLSLRKWRAYTDVNCIFVLCIGSTTVRRKCGVRLLAEGDDVRLLWALPKHSEICWFDGPDNACQREHLPRSLEIEHIRKEIDRIDSLSFSSRRHQQSNSTLWSGVLNLYPITCMRSSFARNDGVPWHLDAVSWWMAW